MSFSHLAQWIGRSEQAEDVVTAAPLKGLAATLDHAEPPWRPDEVPPLGHWLYFLPRAAQHELAADGHPHRGGFLPPVALPRRMWAGGRLTFTRPLRLGEAIVRRSTIERVEHKHGRSGDLVFVAVRHDIATAAGPALSERHDIVYRDAPQPGGPEPGVTDSAAAPAEPLPEPAWRRAVTPDIVMLFRYSALTFNGHRIHYDRDYCRDVEGYPGLVVHGPLIATLLVDLFLRHHPRAAVDAFTYRAHRPLFDIAPFTLYGVPSADGARLWAADAEGRLAMSAELTAQ